MAQPQVLWFEDITIADVPSVGGKNASLGEIVRELGKKGARARRLRHNGRRLSQLPRCKRH